jgi:hypothetical protein
MYDPEIINGVSTTAGYLLGVAVESVANNQATRKNKNRVVNSAWLSTIIEANEAKDQNIDKRYKKSRRLISSLALAGASAGLFSGLIITSFNNQAKTTHYYSGVALDESGQVAVSGFSIQEDQIIKGLDKPNIYYDATSQNNSQLVSKKEVLKFKQFGQSNMFSSASTVASIKGVRQIDMLVGEDDPIDQSSLLVQQAKKNNQKINIFYQAGTNQDFLSQYRSITSSTGGKLLEVNQHNVNIIDQLINRQSISSVKESKTAEQEASNNRLWYIGGLVLSLVLAAKLFNNRRQEILYPDNKRKE